MNDLHDQPEDILDATKPENAGLILEAYCLSAPTLPIVPAPIGREWMEATDQAFAKRCLPLRIANQAGWFILCNARVTVTWDGGDAPKHVRVVACVDSAEVPVSSHFGYGIVTWHIPYLFRTSPGYNLVVRGPANAIKDGIQPLEGIVETDWAVATFTMNWKLTRVNHPVTFEAREPICMLYPQRRGELEAFETRMSDIKSDPGLRLAYLAWHKSRKRFLRDSFILRSNAWQKDYFRGGAPDGSRAPEHQTVLRLNRFRSGRSGHEDFDDGSTLPSTDSR